MLEPCAFFEDMDALINARASVRCSSAAEQAPSPSRPERQAVEMEPQEAPGWEPKETSQEAMGDDDGGSERMSEEETVHESECQGSPRLLQGPRGKDQGLWCKARMCPVGVSTP